MRPVRDSAIEVEAEQLVAEFGDLVAELIQALLRIGILEPRLERAANIESVKWLSEFDNQAFAVAAFLDQRFELNTIRRR